MSRVEAVFSFEFRIVFSALRMAQCLFLLLSTPTYLKFIKSCPSPEVVRWRVYLAKWRSEATSTSNCTTATSPHVFAVQ